METEEQISKSLVPELVLKYDDTQIAHYQRRTSDQRTALLFVTRIAIAA